MTGLEVKETIRGFLSRYVKANVEDDQELLTSRLVNSLFAIELVLFVEKHFKIKVENEDLELKNFNSVRAIAEFIGRKSGGAG
jgi:methoxymalonate biosynthesis acyl carrier protein